MIYFVKFQGSSNRLPVKGSLTVRVKRKHLPRKLDKLAVYLAKEYLLDEPPRFTQIRRL